MIISAGDLTLYRFVYLTDLPSVQLSLKMHDLLPRGESNKHDLGLLASEIYGNRERKYTDSSPKIHQLGSQVSEKCN